MHNLKIKRLQNIKDDFLYCFDEIEHIKALKHIFVFSSNGSQVFKLKKFFSIWNNSSLELSLISEKFGITEQQGKYLIDFSHRIKIWVEA